ncbi:MAG: hypothetical protein HFG00_09985 [Oscillibacter sp.]|nr:hypothetical protein [Oscillibacter sp.]
MRSNKDESIYDTLTKAGTGIPPSDETFSLEEILAEYGGALSDAPPLPETPQTNPPDAAPPAEPAAPAKTVIPAPTEVPPPAPAIPPADTPAPEDIPAGHPSPEDLFFPAGDGPSAPPPEEVPPAPPEPPPDTAPQPPDPVQEAQAAAAIDVERLNLPHSPRPISLEEVVGSTVEAVMEEERAEPILPPPRRGLFSRRPLKQETEELPPPPEPEPEYDPEPIGPEPDLWDAAQAARQSYIARKHSLLLPLLTALPPTAVLLAERAGLSLPYWSKGPRLQCAVLLVCLGLTALLCRHVFLKAASTLLRKRCTAELLVSLAVLVSAADCLCRLVSKTRSDVTPYAAVSCLALVFAQWGVRRESRGNYDMFRAASLDGDPPYLVTNTHSGACKQRGSVPGFYTTAVRSDFASLWQTALLPIYLAASFVFAGLSSIGQGRKADFLLNLSAILLAAGTFSLPLCWALPWSKLAAHLQKTGCAVAGWSGAQKISAQRRMIVTDTDLFPPGAIQLNGQKYFEEESVQAISLAASMARASGSGLERLFNGLIRSEGGSYEPVDDFSFYEEGGCSGIIHGETVLMGTASFLRKMEVRLPADINLKTGVFLAVDRRLTAVFAVKYNPSDNVDFALRMMRRSRILPILASRDPNITPALIRRKFGKSVRMEFPDLSERIALSEAEKDRDLPRALLFREGLLPYAETVAGSLRLCKAVRRAAILSLLGSWAGALLAFYFTSLGAYDLLTPLGLELFLLLWTLPVLLMTDWAGRS